MRGLGRMVRKAGVGQSRSVQPLQRRRCGAAYETIKQTLRAAMPRRPQDGRHLVAAQSSCRHQRIVLARCMTGQGEIDGRGLMRHAFRMQAGAAPGAAERGRRQCGGGCGVVDSHLAHAQQGGLHVDHCVTAREIFGWCQIRHAGEQVDLCAPAEKLATIWAVVPAGHGETPCRTTP